jgi:truncated hemoglobin YjbI
MARDPHPKAPGIDAGVTEPMIRDLVHEFYARVRQDAVLTTRRRKACPDANPNRRSQN